MASLFASKQIVNLFRMDQLNVGWRESDEELIMNPGFIGAKNTEISIPVPDALSKDSHSPTRPTGDNASSSISSRNSANTTAKTNDGDQCEIMHDRSHQHSNTSSTQVDYSYGTKTPLLIIDDLLGQTICHEKGKFRSTIQESWNVSDIEALKDWEFKLTYLVIHDLHHRPAQEGHKHRTRCPQILAAHDFPCNRSKFLVTSLANIGVGAAVRLGVVSHILSAIATDRVPLFVANVTVGPKYLREPWHLASCERSDMQCMFLPTTPCNLLSADLNDAIVMNHSDTSSMRRQGVLPVALDEHKILVVEATTMPARGDTFKGIHNRVCQRVHDRAMLLIDEWYSSNPADLDASRHQFLKAAAQRILKQEKDEKPTDYAYGHRYYRIPHAILLYFLRPNESAKSTLDQHMNNIFKYPLAPEMTIGLPIRGSDKCDRESTCLEFDKYMQLAKETWENSTVSSGRRGSLIMTTEDEDVFRRRALYSNANDFPLDFVVNEGDSLQGSGNVRVFGSNADQIMMSSLVAIKMQLHAGHVYGNCCSNFHLMLFDFARGGCGLTTKATCLQETENYRVCCAWSDTQECVTIRDAYRDSRENAQKKREALQFW